MRAPDVAPLERPSVFMVPRARAAALAQTALFPIQQEPPPEQVMGAALLFAVMASRCGISAADLHTAAMRMLEEHVEGNAVENNEIQSLQDYAGLRVAGADVSIS